MSNIKKIDLNLLAVLDALLDERNVTRSAARLGYTHSVPQSPLSVLRENVISCLHYRVAREPTLGVVLLRRLVS